MTAMRPETDSQESVTDGVEGNDSTRHQWVRAGIVVVWALMILYVIGVERGSGLLELTKILVVWSGRSTTHHALLTVAVGALALLLYGLKRRGRVRYGALEIVFACAVAWYALGSAATSTEAVFAELVGACYVFVRGLENVEQGLTSDPSR